jgi:hypothetical protein
MFPSRSGGAGGGISTEGGSTASDAGDPAPASGGAPAPVDGSSRLARGPPGLRRSCGAGSMSARGVAAPGSSGLLASRWCQ